MTKVSSCEEVEEIPDGHYDIGFNDIYETPEGKIITVPDGTEVPDDWELISS